MLLLAANIIPVRYLRPLAAKILIHKSKTQQGYNRSCHRLVDLKVAREIFPQSLTPKWWTADPLVQVRRLGFMFSLDLRDNLQRCIYFTGTYEPETLNFIRSELRTGDTFIDVGAHIGLHSLVASRRLAEFGEGKVLAFEPTPDSAKRLQNNAKNNKLPVELHQLALGQENSKVPMFGDAQWGIHDAAVRSLSGNGPIVYYVDVVKFDDWNEKHSLNRIDMIKIDAEGAEYDIIKGMESSLLKYQPRLIIMELKDHVIQRTKKTQNDILELMSMLGYQSDNRIFGWNQVFKLMSKIYKPIQARQSSIIKD